MITDTLHVVENRKRLVFEILEHFQYVPFCYGLPLPCLLYQRVFGQTHSETCLLNAMTFMNITQTPELILMSLCSKAMHRHVEVHAN